ncbi:unnamed protein product (macronuclear) [Paramecium tetraurelia]|uniref:RING-type domain-containing protein n=1 Tax=Paramecium tetraurelia TaxID=5888 RepID=A0BTB0_PARTE|nr:uncharacterized protein GSPATT00032009001 [Paramecium tetraurelia]CAK61777.1 unnamed protein product [Paramecium tetraurelia]|eukprot:XP_001429175.1 hypothetical protein (macronuclear) [Paramecium tetraurelia strain d4-2]
MQKNPSAQEYRSHLVNPQSIDKFLLCQICQQLVFKPQECESCQKIFCLYCLQKWMSICNNETCPSHCKQYKIRKPHQIVTNAINQILVRCGNNGCSEQMIMGNLETHIKICQKVHKPNLFEQKQDTNHGLFDDYCQKCNTKYSQFCQHDCIKKHFNNFKIKLKKLLSDNLFERVSQCEKQQNNLGDPQNGIKQPQLGNPYQEQPQVLFGEEEELMKLQDPSQVQQQVNFDIPLCELNHKLKWIYPQNNIICTRCKLSDISVRYVCEQCRTCYCQKCRKPQIQQGLCPIGHALIFQLIAPQQVYCDSCLLNISSRGEAVYSDRFCDLDLCNSCYSNLQKQYQQ